jgi:hypothetical protein
LTNQGTVSYKEWERENPVFNPILGHLKRCFILAGYGDIMEEQEGPSPEIIPEEEKKREVDLNNLFPGKGYDLNRLFPDEGTKRLLHELKRNKRDIDRFIKSLNLEEEE